jgi:small subunit ribosomal protein S6
MPANVYECMFLLDTNKVAGDVQAAAKQLHGILERNHAEMLASRPWDERRLAYPIGNHKKGLYYLTYFRTDGKNVVNIEKDCKLNEMIVRMLVLRVEPKLVDAMLSVARDEHAVALPTVHQEEPGEGEPVAAGAPAGGEGGNGRDRAPRGPRGPRGPRAEEEK